MLPSANPYASPKGDGADSSPGSSPDRGAKRLYFGWLVVFALNLVVPLFMAWGVTGPEGRIGMLLAILVILAIGFWICAKARQVGFALVVGGVAIALSQVFPIMQMMAGGLGFAVAETLGVSAPTEIAPSKAETVVAGFIVTMMTGGLLVAASLVAGLAIRGVLSLRGCRTD